MKRLLVLAGGSLAGSYQLGVIKNLVIQQGLDFDVIAGTSIGAINAAYLAQSELNTREIEAYIAEMENLWTDIPSSKVYIKPRFLSWLRPFIGQSMYDNSGITKKIWKTIDRERILKSGRELRIDTVDVTTGRTAIIEPTNPNFIDFIIASTSIPFIFTPYTYNGFGGRERLYIDGGIRDNTPVKAAFQAASFDDEYEMHIIMCYPTWLPTCNSNIYKNPIKYAIRMIDILRHDVVMSDIETAQLYNKQIQSGHCTDKVFTKMYIYRPKYNPIPNPMIASQAELKSALHAGFQDGFNPTQLS